MKRIIVCLDGTWNNANLNKPPTNIVRIRDAVAVGGGKDGAFQRIYYDEGVGSDDSDPVDRWVGGSLGWGIGRNVRQAYKYLCKHYDPRDQIYLIGFSRGAHTARSVAGMVGACGLLRPDECTSETEEAAWAFYRTPKKDRSPGDEKAMRQKTFAGVKIRCVAVFDTVGALGIPDNGLNWIGRSKFAFHDTRLGTTIEKAFHAVAIDEHRRAYRATMWEKPFNEAGDDCPAVEQVWFPGVHSDVGGGYRDRDAPELGRISLYWMIRRLQSVDLVFKPEKLAEYFVDVSRREYAESVMHDSWSLFYQFLDRFKPHHRSINGRFIETSRRGRPQLEYDPISEFIHQSVLDRCVKTRGYRPLGLRGLGKDLRSGSLEVVDWDGNRIAPGEVASEYAAVLDDLG